MPHITVVVVDDHPLVHDAIESKLANQDDIQIVGSGTSGDEVTTLVAKHQPDILIMDLKMPNGTKNFQPINTIYKISNQYPSTKIIILTSYLVPTLIQETLQRRVRGYLLKSDQLSRKLLDAINTVSYGGLYFSETISQKLDMASTATNSTLSDRQISALKHVFNDPDQSYAQHAASMNITTSTFKQHLSAAYRALGVQNITGAMVRCVQLGIVGQRDEF